MVAGALLDISPGTPVALKCASAASIISGGGDCMPQRVMLVSRRVGLQDIAGIRASKKIHDAFHVGTILERCVKMRDRQMYGTRFGHVYKASHIIVSRS